jgi:hypothetical protein
VNEGFPSKRQSSENVLHAALPLPVNHTGGGNGPPKGARITVFSVSESIIAFWLKPTPDSDGFIPGF